MKQGTLIVIEGVDGSGKETQSKNLVTHLKQDGYDVLALSYPRYHKDSSAMVRHYLAGDFGTHPEDVSPYVASTFYAADRYASYKEEMAKHLAQGGVVIADRYTTANMVHQAGKMHDPVEKRAFLDWVEDYEFNLLGLPRPDGVFFLDVPPALSAKLIKDRANKITGQGEKDIHEADPRHLEDAYINALDLVRRYGWYQIGCAQGENLRSIEDIHSEIYTKVKEILDGRS